MWLECLKQGSEVTGFLTAATLAVRTGTETQKELPQRARESLERGGNKGKLYRDLSPHFQELPTSLIHLPQRPEERLGDTQAQEERRRVERTDWPPLGIESDVSTGVRGSTISNECQGGQRLSRQRDVKGGWDAFPKV